MRIDLMLNNEWPVGEMLSSILDSNALQDFKFTDKIGLGSPRLRDGYRKTIETFRRCEKAPLLPESRELYALFQNPAPSISPLSALPSSIFEIATKLKYRLHRVLNVPDSVRLEMLLDSMSYGCHAVSTQLEMAYRDHYVHPIAVAALGVHILLHGSRPLLSHIADKLWTSEKGRRLLDVCVPGGIAYLDHDLGTDGVVLNVARPRRSSFVLLAWLIAGVDHDIGRHLITMTQVQASNSYEKENALSPIFYNYASRSCFDKKDRVSKLCSCCYPLPKYVKPFLRFMKQACLPALPIVQGRLRKGELGTNIKGMGRKDHPDDVDHAILSSLALFTWASMVEKNSGKKVTAGRDGVVSAVAALRLASASVLIHHLGSKQETRHALSQITSFDENPLGVLLRVVDFFHSACRPYIYKYTREFTGMNLLIHRIEFLLRDTVDWINMCPNNSDRPLAFTFEISSCLGQALEWAANRCPEYKDQSVKTDEFMSREREKFRNEFETLRQWLEDIETGVKWKVEHK